MHNSARRIFISSSLVLILYFVPNLVQDLHRIFDHHDLKQYFGCAAPGRFVLHSTHEKCSVCAFEFNVVEKQENLFYTPVLPVMITLFTENTGNHIPDRSFHYYNLRAPPIV